MKCKLKSSIRMIRWSMMCAGLVAGAANGAPPFVPDEQPYGTIAPLALTGFNLSAGDKKAFQSWFDPFTWDGDLVAYPVDATGHTDKDSKFWSTREIFNAKQACYATSPGSLTYYDTGRRIVTRNGTTNVAFRLASLSAAQQTAIGDANTLNFLRGDRSKEKYQVVLAGDGAIEQECGVKSPGTGTYRARGSILGDIMHARPVHVGAPPADYIFDSYQVFKNSNVKRDGRVYVGANDGMVHAFRVDNGEEEWAYIPSMLVSNLKLLSVDPYTHKFFIDGGLTGGDVNFGTSGSPSWRTVLVGGLGAGGKGLFALDVTSPDAANEAAAAAKVLWEITPASSGFADLGDTYGDPVIVRLSTGQWAAIVGNGYNNLGNGHAVLYIIDITTGALIRALDTGSGGPAVTNPNGLSSPVAIDTNFDGKVDRVYAGDIDGNLWKFDISNVSAAAWTAPTTPVFASGLPITGAPDVAGHPISGLMVYFTTGRLFTAADATNATVQNYAYGIWDGAPVANNTILEQTLTNKTYGDGQGVRVSSGLPVNWNDGSNVSLRPLHKGWRTALKPGERVLGTGFVRDARYHFTSVNPTIDNEPNPDGENWLHELDFLTGGVGEKLIFDLNSSGTLEDADRVAESGTPVQGPTGIPVAVYEGAGLLSQPILAIISSSLSTTMFNSNTFTSPGESRSVQTFFADPGVSGGHFDVDIYYDGTGVSKKHTHEYDDIFNVTGVNFLNASEPLFNVSNAIPGNGTKFKILVANQRLSPAVNFSFGGNPYVPLRSLKQTEAGLTVASLPTFTRADVKSLKYNMPKDAFASKDWGTGETRVGLVPTQTGCVKGTMPGTIGPAGEYRNGALVFQLIKDTTPDSAIQLSQAGDPRYGYRLKNANYSSYILAEWSTFWHHPNKACMGDAGWTQTPPQDTDPSSAKQTSPAAGSEDPPRDTFGSVISTTTGTGTETTTDSKGKTVLYTVETTTTTYSSGAQVIVKVYKDAGGKVKDTVITVVPGQPTAGGGGGPNQSLSAPNTVTGYQQTRNSGKLGRVTWREVFGR
jgi:PilC-like protein with beta-propeller domain